MPLNSSIQAKWIEHTPAMRGIKSNNGLMPVYLAMRLIKKPLFPSPLYSFGAIYFCCK